jgi:hypothetical protein
MLTLKEYVGLIKELIVVLAFMFIVAASIVGLIYLMGWNELGTPQSCECKRFDVGYSQACEDLETYSIEGKD